MNQEELISFALSLPEAVESAHHGTRDFRVRSKIFLTMPDENFCVVRLTPDQQHMTLAVAPDDTAAVPGGYGLRGATRLFYGKASDELVQDLVRKAWQNAAPRTLQRQFVIIPSG
ncbi:MmcQ/YjbR family DNA-binding protein [Rhizobium mesoamericanum]|uniref:MmcQ/YjbR family DNA-binding protein n=1 Tax=Rhizobium mesoamericanum TaxID=1079800 RepID=UPI0003FC4E87|nr:MmcQ/YjbR family DNA-binding protein [Rhizobium mesoamericanum]